MKTKTLCTLACTLLLGGCTLVPKIARHAKVSRAWEKTVAAGYMAAAPRAVHVCHIRGGDTGDSNAYNYTMVYAGAYQAYLNDDWQVYERFDSTAVVSIDAVNRDIMSDTAGGTLYRSDYNQRAIYPVMYFPELAGPYAPYKDFKTFTGMSDTVLQGKSYRVFRVSNRNQYLYNKETGQYDIPKFYDVHYFYNTADRQLERVVVQPVDTAVSHMWKEEFLIHTDLGINPDTLVGTLFDTASPAYTGFTMHDSGNLPYSLRPASRAPDTLTGPFLGFPMVDTRGDTTTVTGQEGWLLLDFWTFGCPGCRKRHLAWRSEQQAEGTTAMEREGITVLSVNPISDNAALISREAAQCFPAGAKVYHAKGINVHLRMNTYPQYYLISPDKKIVFTSGYMADYSSLIEAKRQYSAKNEAQ